MVGAPGARASTGADAAVEREIEGLLAQVPDPELPVLTIRDLGILRDVSVRAGRVEVTITPTYSGCPAVEAIEDDIRGVLAGRGYESVSVRVELSPAWTTDWMSEEGRRKLRDYGIAPPEHLHGASGPTSLTLSVRCPQCGSPDTRELTRFGSTACKALWTCRACLEPFDRFKPL